MFGKTQVPYIAQLETVECGAACLAMILAHHGHHAPLVEVRERCGVSRDGVSALAMLQAAESYGLEARLYRAELDGLKEIPLPAILHWDFNHFVVLERLERNGSALIIDPAQGRVPVIQASLARSFTGAVLVLEPTDALVRRRPQRPRLGRYTDLLRAHAGALAQVLGFSLLLQVFGLIFPVGTQFLVDNVLVTHQSSWLLTLSVAMALAVVVQAVLQFARGWVLSAQQAILDLRLLGDFMMHTVHLPVGFFHQRNPGDLLQRLESNRDLRHFLGTEITAAALDTLLLVGYGTLMMIYQWQIGLLVAGLGALRALIQFGLREMNRQAAAVELGALSRAGSTLVETLGALETICAASAEAVSVRRWIGQVIDCANAGLPRLRLEATAAELSSLLNGLGVAAVSAAAGYQVIGGQMSIGVFAALLALQGLFLTPLNALLENLERWQFLHAHFQRLGDVMEALPEPGGSLDANHLRGEIRLQGVSFRYAPGSPWVLRDIDLHLRPGERLAIVGPSGAGKSTLARLLLGMLLPAEGRLEFDGREIGDYDLQALRSRMGAVLQESALLGDTVRANLDLYDDTRGLAAIRQAAALACIDMVIERLPEGYDTRLGDDGLQLSGGERQRICLARALARQPAVLVLDEATSSLDAETERQVHAGLDGLDCTRIVIAHRFATVRDTDRIIVLDGGCVVQQGSYPQLAAQPGLFRTLLESYRDPASH